MNKHGQTLIIFIILIPVIIMMAALVIDIGHITYHYQKYRGIIESGIYAYYENNNKSDLENVLKYNEVYESEYLIVEKSEEIEVGIEKEIDAIFGKIINIKSYPIKITRVGKKTNEGIIINRKNGD